MAHETVHGYKGFNPDMTCRGFQYEVGKTYEMDGEIVPCEQGFHFCRNAADVFDFYGRKGCRYAKVKALGKVVDDGDKFVTNKLRIVHELSWSEVLNAMYAQEELDFEDIPFPTDETIRARENGTLSEMLPSGTEFPVRFTNGERNILVVCRDRDHTYLVTKYVMAEPFAMNGDMTNKGGWPACEMRKHVQEIYNMLPKDIQKLVIPMHIRQIVRDDVVECEDKAFLLSAVNVFGEEAWYPEIDCKDTQIDIFQKPVNRIKHRPGASSASWWWLRSALGTTGFCSVYTDGICDGNIADYDDGVAVGFCVEERSLKD